jgi:serine/threonine protein kinase
MTSSVEQLCDKIAERRLLSSADLSRLRARWFRPNRAEVNDVDKFAQWLTVNGYLTAFAVRMLRSGKADLLRLNQYQLLDHLVSGPFAGAYLAVDPLQRHVVLEVLAANRAADPKAVQAFQVAADKARSVRHTNVNLTLDFGEAQGRHYLVREFDEGETLTDILTRRGRLKPIISARLFALALLGLQALHENQVPAGPLDANSLLLSVAGKSARNKARNVKILNAGVPRSQFDPSALDTAITAAPPSGGTGVSPVASADPREDLFRLGCTFYHSLTGQPPYSPILEAELAPRATPIRQLAPDVPELLAQLVESMIDTNPAQRPRGAAQAAKSLRVLLASEEETTPSQPEEELVPHPIAPAAAPEPEPASAAVSSESVAEKQPAGGGALTQQFKMLWDELRPSQRDWVFLSIGAAAVVLMVLLLTLLTGIGFVNVVCLLTGGALSFFVERMLRLREGQAE